MSKNIYRNPLFLVVVLALACAILTIIKTSLTLSYLEKNITWDLVLSAKSENQYWEAESGDLSAPMSEYSDSIASAGKYITSKSPGLGSVIFTVNISTSDTYVLWGRILSPGPEQDSFYISLDGTTDDLWDTAEGLWSNNWQWTRVTGRNANLGIPSVGNINPRLFLLVAGTHTFRFITNESNTKLDRLFLTNNLNLTPTDTPGEITTTPKTTTTESATESGYKLVKYPDSPTVYLLENGKKRGIPSYSVYLANFRNVPISIIPEGEEYPDGSVVKFFDGVLLKGSSPTVYLIESGKKRPFISAYAFWERGYDFASVKKVSDTDLALHEDGERLK